ncbi:MAG: YraN family protein [Treponema sp.]
MLLPIDKHIRIGSAGELFAKAWFEERTYSIVAQNWRTATGEIDLIATKHDTLVFIEVKTLPHTALTDLDIIIGKRKQAKIYKTAQYFLSLYQQYTKMHIRFDVFVLPFDPRKTVQIPPFHIKNAFGDCI